MKKTVWTENDIKKLESDLGAMGADVKSLRRVLIDDQSREGTFKAIRMIQEKIDALIEEHKAGENK